MNKIYFLLAICLLILSLSCGDRVLVTEPIPTSNKTTLESVPDYILGKYTVSSVNHRYMFLASGQEISILENENILYINVQSNEDSYRKIMFDLRSNITYSSKEGYPEDVAHGKKLKIFTKNKNTYVNIPDEEGYWYFMVIKPLIGERIKVTFSRFSEDEFQKNKYAYETDENFMSYSNSKLIFDVKNEDKFEEILNDGKLLTSIVLEKQIQ